MCTTLKNIEEETIELIISDNGLVYPEGFDLMKQNTLGMQLFHKIATRAVNGGYKDRIKSWIEIHNSF